MNTEQYIYKLEAALGASQAILEIHKTLNISHLPRWQHAIDHLKDCIEECKINSLDRIKILQSE